MSDEQKAERKALIESNQAMRAANETRRAFVRDYLNRRSAPKGALRYALETMHAQRWALARWFNGMANQVESEVREVLGITSGPVSDARVPLAVLAQVAGAIESGIHPQSWRHPDASVAEWLRFLIGQGYELADIEQHIVDAVPATAAPTADDVDE